jgi:hypothetical protein
MEVSNMHEKIELWGDKLDLQLLHTALTDLLDTVNYKGDTYNTAYLIGALIEQVEEVKASWEDN